MSLTSFNLNGKANYLKPYTLVTEVINNLNIYTYGDDGLKMSSGGFAFIIEIRKHVEEYIDGSENCFFPNNDFSISSAYNSRHLAVDNKDGSHSISFILYDRGLYSINIFYAVKGVEVKIWDKLEIIEEPRDAHIQQEIGKFNLSLFKRGVKSKSVWKADFISEVDLFNA